MVYKLLAETEEENLYICDGKNDELYELCAIIWYRQCWNIPHRIGEKRFARLKNHGATIADSKERDASDFLLLMSLSRIVRIVLDRKRICRNQWQFKKNYIDG